MKLIKDSYAFLCHLAELPDDDIFKMWGYIASIDVQDLDERKLPELNLRIGLLEKGLYHPSVWIVQLAVHLYLHVADAQNIKATAVRAFAAGRGITLSAASRLAEQLGEETAIEIVCDRLTNPLVSGCEYLFNLLRRLNVKAGRNVLAAVENGLMTGDEDTAVSAASLAEEMAKPGDAKLLSVIDRAYDHWLKHEKPYPKAGGVIPRSPREKLLLGRLKVETPSIVALIGYSRDVRSDVSKVGIDATIERLQASAEARSTFVQTVLTERPNTGLLRAALHQKVPFSGSELDSLCKLLEADDDTVRLAALGLLSENYLTKERIKAFAKTLVGDKDQDIREGAFRALDRLLPPKIPRVLPDAP